MKNLLVLLLLGLLVSLGCDLAQDTKGEAEHAGGAAVGIAENASKGTLEGYDDDANLNEDEDTSEDEDE